MAANPRVQIFAPYHRERLASARDLVQAVQAAMNGLAASGELGRLFAARRVSWRAA